MLSSSAFPAGETPLLSLSHRAGGDRIPSAVWERDYHAEQIAASEGLAEYVEYWILAGRPGALDQRSIEADLLHFLRRHAMRRDMSDSIFRPDEFTDLHGPDVIPMWLLIWRGPEKRVKVEQTAAADGWPPESASRSRTRGQWAAGGAAGWWCQPAGGASHLGQPAGGASHLGQSAVARRPTNLPITSQSQIESVRSKEAPCRTCCVVRPRRLHMPVKEKVLEVITKSRLGAPWATSTMRSTSSRAGKSRWTGPPPPTTAASQTRLGSRKRLSSKTTKLA